MAETRRKFDADFREGAVRLVRETGKPIAQVARDLGINAGTLGNWVNAGQRRGVREPLTADDIAEVVTWTVTRPSHVNVDLLVIRPRAQAAQHKVHRER
jgi:transposase-like protein